MKVILLIGVVSLGAIVSPVCADEPDFNRDVRPVLSDKCYFCHGPDADNQQADLRLDTFDGSRDVIESGYLLERILSDDPDERMPPPEAKVDLSDEEKQILTAWAESGGKYENHWAFEPLPKFVPVKISQTDNWSKSDLDRFVWNELRRKNRMPNEEADPLRWLRRVTFDLTGLPPTSEEIEVLQKDLRTENERESVYQKTVDRILDSPSYGEHMAVAWLDAARYADSYGYQSDRLNSQWPYRDWVVKAFNENLSYDKFLTWQLAGDLLESPTQEQILATAFNRVHRLNNEGGAVFEEWRIENVADRVQTFGTAILGLTLECCKCHDHKYDPIPMRDFYSLSAFFNSIDENGVYDVSQKIPMPSLLLPDDSQAARLKSSKEEVDRLERAYQQSVSEAAKRFQDWKPDEVSSSTQLPDHIRSLTFDTPFDKEKLNDVYYWGSGDAYQAKTLDAIEVDDVPFPVLANDLADDAITLADKENSPSRKAIQLDGERGVVMPGITAFDRWTPFSIVLTVKDTKSSKLPVVISQASFGQLTFNGWDLISDSGYLELRMYRVWPGNMVAVRTKDRIPHNQWIQLAATYDGSSKAAGLKVYLDGKSMETEVIRDNVKKRSSVKGNHGGKLTIGQRFRDRGMAGWFLDDVRVFGRALTEPEIKHLATGEPLQPTKAFYVSAIDAEARKTFSDLTTAREQFVMTEEAIHEIPVMEEMPKPRETHVLARGEYDAPTNDSTQVTRKTLSNIGPEFPEGVPLDRLGLARWVTDPEHPLTSRVIVNRLWSNFFGQGLVRTPDNFGLQGELPTHPELLDWLARDFVDHEWNVKRLCRSIVLSSTYRQESRASRELMSADPENKWLARGPAYRLSSEQIRDLALASSGLLNDKRGGPPVSPYQAGGDLWRESNIMSPAYEQSVGKDLYRRSLYSVWKRTAPLPNMLAFDAESREVCIVKRSRTNTPLQALVLMNDQQFVEAARALAEKTMVASDELSWRIDMAFLRLTGRSPDEREATTLRKLYESEFAYYKTEESSAKLLISSGESTPNESLNPIELAAMTVVCQAIMNLDATIWKR